ncbi:D-2-hydroxyacid dehydrogenase [Porticoccus sp. W117]|uniref:D-2-hydroxyacid dehydrogenase n=1 Tax=Porticoccus sp. W117 TaxID=3054777 RepID=UPI002595D6FB|nr:D-2-hydroxyacid dehydrogenase [Porticoccus sp. W117]MDM3870459.1 D-2-hydroxyacid dehydrogenase [Porticoccus sp. W117]
MNQLLILSNDADEYAEKLRCRNLPDLEIFTASHSDQAQQFASHANIILGTPALIAPLLHRAPNLQWVQSSFAGVEPFCAPELRRDYLLTGVKGIFGPLMSEYVFAYILAFERNLFATRKNQCEKRWHSIPYRSLGSLTIGICGLGSIGQHIAKTAAHFNMTVLGLSRSAKQIVGVEKVFPPEVICDLSQQVDYLVSALPNTSETQGIINDEVFKALGPSAVFINVGRGATVDEPALIDALHRKVIRGAVLDVFQTEPLPQDNPLWCLDSAFVTPHNSAVTFPADITELFFENYKRFQAGQRLQHVIDFSREY